MTRKMHFYLLKMVHGTIYVVEKNRNRVGKGDSHFIEPQTKLGCVACVQNITPNTCSCFYFIQIFKFILQRIQFFKINC